MMLKIVVLSYGFWVSMGVDTMSACQAQAQRVFQINNAAEVWCCSQQGCEEQKKELPR